MALDLIRANYNPDVLSCLANLSSDEVFTPPEVVNQMLDMLPQKLFSNPDTTFLDPATKSGVFLREIAKRLMRGLEKQIPDLQERVDHIFQKQLFGVAITELTSLLARRSLYCSKYPNSRFSITKFPTADGNIGFKKIQHTWVNGKCTFCSANQGEYDRGSELETHAYEWIHTLAPERIFNMKFDVIISNPPYQLSDGGNAASALPIYNSFVLQSKKLNPRYLAMIIPSRWFMGGRGLDSFRDEMLHDKHIRVIHDFPDSSECFPGVEIKGGVCYFLRDRDNEGLCTVYSHNGADIEISERPLLEDGMDTFIRNDTQISILHKVRSKGETSFSTWLNAGRYFGFHTKVEWSTDTFGTIQTADGKDRIDITKQKTINKDVKVFVHGGECWVSRFDVPKNTDSIDCYKVLIPRSGNPGGSILGKPKISPPGSCSSNTYVVAIPNNDVKLTREEACNIVAYLTTKFVRYLIATKTSTQDMPPKAYEFVPMQDFSQSWNDEKLYTKYSLTQKEIATIEALIPDMAIPGGES